MIRRLALAACLVAALNVPQAELHAQPVRVQSTAAPVDIAQVIRDAAKKSAGQLTIAPPQAAQRMDRMLIEDYRSRGTIAGERNVRLKQLYVQAAHLLMNNAPIAGGTLVMIASQDDAFPKSAVGPAYVTFVNAMLAPTGEHNDDLGPLAERARKARAKLAPVRPELRMGAELEVMGAIYGDAVAVAAGRAALKQQGATGAELAAVAAARAAGGASK